MKEIINFVMIGKTFLYFVKYNFYRKFYIIFVFFNNNK